MELKNNLYVVSLTHWDREWRFPFEKTLSLLVEMIDGLLDGLERDPDYATFHLDGQTVLLDDYCAVRPQNAERLRRLIEQGRIMIGPWYVLPEENQMSGESLVRNFLWGERLGRKYGGNMKVGYTPTSWGQISQMPQIFRGVGVDSVIFYRGISGDQVPGHYYLWEGPDGTRIFGIRLGDYARSSFFHLVDRPVVFDRGRPNQTHDWALGGKPFRLCGSGSDAPYHFYQPPMDWHPERLESAFTELEDVDLGKWETPYALAMECNDSTGLFVMTPRIVAEANKRVTNGKKIVHGNLPEFVRMAREHLDEGTLTVVKGEMRHPQRAGVWTDLYAEVQATRIPLKYANRRAEYRLQRDAEPWAALAWLLGVKYPQFRLDRANELLLQCHAHDSIGGCGVDAVADEVMFRFRQVEILAGSVQEGATREIGGRIDTAVCAPSDILLVVYNPLPRPASGVADAEIDIAKDRAVEAIGVTTTDGAAVPCQIADRKDFLATFNHPQELPLRTWSDRWTFSFYAEDVPALGYRVYRVESATDGIKEDPGLLTGDRTMENEHLRVTVNSNGTVDVLDKARDRLLRQQNLFEDRGDVGDYWIGAFPEHDTILTSTNVSAELRVIENGPLAAAIEATLEMDLPVCATPDCSKRVAATRPVQLTTIYRLLRGERFLRITTTVQNTVEDHILRARFPTGVQTDTACAEVAFDVLERAIPIPDTTGWREPYKPVQPHRSFVDLSDGKTGFALLNRGLPQYEAVDDADRTLALTLLRAHRAWNSVRLAYYPDQTGTQLQDEYTFEYALLPHGGTWDAAGVQYEAEQFNLPFAVAAAGPGPGVLPLSLSFLQVEGHGLMLDAVKKGEWDDSLIVRISNPTCRRIKGALRLHAAVDTVELLNLLETEVEGTVPVRDGAIALDVQPKKILTLRIRTGAR